MTNARKSPPRYWGWGLPADIDVVGARADLVARLKDDDDPLADALTEPERKLLICQLDIAAVYEAQNPKFLDLLEAASKAFRSRGVAPLRPFAGDPKQAPGNKSKDRRAMLHAFLEGSTLEEIREAHGVSNVERVWQRYIRPAAKAEGIAVERPEVPK